MSGSASKHYSVQSSLRRTEKLLTGLVGPFIAAAQKGDYLDVKKKRKMKVYELGGKSMIRIRYSFFSIQA